MRLLGAVLPILIPGLAFAATETREFDLSDISAIELKNTSGDVKVVGVDQGPATVVADKRTFGKHCQIIISKKDKTLLIEVREGVSNTTCRVDFEISAPKAADLKLKSGSGDVAVKGISGTMEFSVGSGDVEVDGEIKNLKAYSGSGDISIKGLTAGGEVKTGSGEVELVYNQDPEDGDLSVILGSGDAKITFPETAKVQTILKTGSGSVKNELGDNPEGRFRLMVKSGSGDLSIKKR